MGGVPIAPRRAAIPTAAAPAAATATRTATFGVGKATLQVSQPRHLVLGIRDVRDERLVLTGDLKRVLHAVRVIDCLHVGRGKLDGTVELVAHHSALAVHQSVAKEMKIELLVPPTADLCEDTLSLELTAATHKLDLTHELALNVEQLVQNLAILQGVVDHMGRLVDLGDGLLERGVVRVVLWCLLAQLGEKKLVPGYALHGENQVALDGLTACVWPEVCGEGGDDCVYEYRGRCGRWIR